MKPASNTAAYTGRPVLGVNRNGHHWGTNSTLRDSISAPQRVFLPKSSAGGISTASLSTNESGTSFAPAVTK